MKKLKIYILFALVFTLNLDSNQKSLSQLESEKLKIDRDELAKVLEEIATDLIELKKRQYKVITKVEKLAKEGAENRKKIDILSLILDEQKSLIKDIVLELNSKEQKRELERERVSKLPAKSEIKNFKPTTFILKRDSSIFLDRDSIIESWKRGERFTSYRGDDNFIKITGKIVAGEWVEIDKNIWIERDSVDVYR